MYLSLGNLLLNGPITSDEISFVTFVFILAKGGVSLEDAVPLQKIPFLPQLPGEYITLQRAVQITQIVLNKAVQKGYFEKFIVQGKATDMIKDVSLAEANALKSIGNKLE